MREHDKKNSTFLGKKYKDDSYDDISTDLSSDETIALPQKYLLEKFSEWSTKHGISQLEQQGFIKELLQDLPRYTQPQNAKKDDLEIQKEFSDNDNFNQLYDAVASNNVELVKSMNLKNIPLAFKEKSVVSAIIYSNKYSSLEEREFMLNLLSKSGNTINIDDQHNSTTKSALSYFYEQNFSYIDEEYMKKTFFDTVCTGDFNDMMDNI